MAESEGRLTELRTALRSKIDENDDIAKSFKLEEKSDSPDAPGTVGVVVTPEQRDAFRKNLDHIKEIKSLIEDLESLGEMERFAGSSDGRGSVAVAANAGATDTSHDGRRPQTKSMGHAFTESDEFKALKDSGGATMQRAWEFKGDLGAGAWYDQEQKDVYTALPGTMTTRGFGRMQIDPIVPQQFRTVRVRDLFPVVTTDANLIDYFKVSGFTNSASPVPERSGSAFALKPQSSIQFTVGQAPVRLIAHWEAAHRNVLNDEPQIQGIINNELLYGLRLQEDYQILSGVGTSEDLTGILNTAGIQTYAKQASPENNADAVRKAVTKIMLAYYEPTGVVFHPNNWETTELLKDSQNRYIVAGSVAVGADKTLWRMPVVDTPAIPQGTGLVGAFGLGAQLYDREQGTIRIAEQHSDFFIRNAVVVLAEERLALAVKRPESFCTVTSLA